MKKIILTLGVLFSLNVVFAQISEQTRSMSLGTNNALVLEIPKSQEKFVNKLWKKYVENFYDSKTKWNRKTDEWLSDNASIVGLGGANTVDIYGVAVQQGENVSMTMWVDLGGAFLSSSSHPDRYTEAEKILMRFGLEVTRESIKLELKEEEKKQKKLANKMKKLKKANEKYHRNIEKAKEAIAKAEAGIVQNVKDQENATKEIELQRVAVDNVRKKLNDL